MGVVVGGCVLGGAFSGFFFVLDIRYSQVSFWNVPRVKLRNATWHQFPAGKIQSRWSKMCLISFQPRPWSRGWGGCFVLNRRACVGHGTGLHDKLKTQMLIAEGNATTARLPQGPQVCSSFTNTTIPKYAGVQGGFCSNEINSGLLPPPIPPQICDGNTRHGPFSGCAFQVLSNRDWKRTQASRKPFHLYLTHSFRQKADFAPARPHLFSQKVLTLSMWKMRSSSHTFSKHLSNVSTNTCNRFGQSNISFLPRRCKHFTLAPRFIVGCGRSCVCWIRIIVVELLWNLWVLMTLVQSCWTWVLRAVASALSLRARFKLCNPEPEDVQSQRKALSGRWNEAVA